MVLFRLKMPEKYEVFINPLADITLEALDNFPNLDRDRQTDRQTVLSPTPTPRNSSKRYLD